MSSSKIIKVLSDESREELCLSNVSQNRQSFSDRICDDLCEEILQYLSLEDKLKLEGVSKQFQRTVLKKHNELIIKNNKMMLFRKDKKEYNYLYKGNKVFDLELLEKLLKKCPNITSIDMREHLEKCDYNEVFRLITKYCNNLRQIEFWDNEISDENFKEFQRKFGPKIKFIYRFTDDRNYSLFPNIEELKEIFLSLSSSDSIFEVKLNKLKKLEVRIAEQMDEMLQKVIQRCVETFPTLTHFSLQIDSCNQNEIFKSLEFISNLKQLKHFAFDNNNLNAKNNTLFCEILKRMANKCQKLKSIKCQFDITPDFSDLSQLLSLFEAFPALKRLNLMFIFHDFEFYISEKFSFEAFKGLSNITHLTLAFDDWDESENFANILTDIEIYLP